MTMSLHHRAASAVCCLPGTGAGAFRKKITLACALTALLLTAPLSTVGQPNAGDSDALTSDPATLKRGRILFLQCQACHSLGAGESHRVGPNLHGIFGSKAAAKPDFNYSEALQTSGITWDVANLDEFLTMPSAKVPGTIMAFAGVAEQRDREALLSYLRTQTNP